MSNATGYRFLSVVFRDAYGQKEIIADVWGADHDHQETRRESDWRARVTTGPFAGDQIEDLELTAYIGHGYGDSRPTDEIWGERYEFKPHRVQLRDAQRMVRVLSALERKFQKIADEDGYHQSFAEWLTRMAKILGCTRIRVWKDTGYQRGLGPAMRLSEGAAYVEAAARKWANGASLADATA